VTILAVVYECGGGVAAEHDYARGDIAIEMVGPVDCQGAYQGNERWLAGRPGNWPLEDIYYGKPSGEIVLDYNALHAEERWQLPWWMLVRTARRDKAGGRQGGLYRY
jgi:hypothetical protein